MRRNPLLAIFTTVFIDLVGFGILIPVFPLLIGVGSPFRVTPESWSFTKGLIMLGWLQAVYPLITDLAQRSRWPFPGGLPAAQATTVRRLGRELFG